jgi:hypothetical protein
LSDELTDTWPPRWKPGAHFKQPVIAKAVRAAKTTKRASRERKQKDVVRERDGYCRFPLCGCRKLKLSLESAHLKHKGMGGNPKENLSEPEKLITLCVARHRRLPISMHSGTLRVKPLTDAGTAGPCAFSIDIIKLWGRRIDPSGKARGLDKMLADHPAAGPRWVEVGRETARHSFEPFTVEQATLLKRLAAMTL